MKLSESCGFGALRESLVCDRLILGVKDDRVREKLLGKRDLNLNKAIKIIKGSQVTCKRATEISDECSANEDINAVGQKSKPKHGKGSHANLPARTLPRLKSVCSLVVHMHWKGNCVQLQVRNARSVAKKAILKSSVEVSLKMQEMFYVHSVSGKDQALVSLTLNGSASVIFQIDTGSSASILPLQDYIRATKDYSRANIVPKEITLVMHNHSKQTALGSARLKVEHKGNKHELNFVIVDQEVTPFLCLKSSQGMGLVKLMVPGVHTPVNNIVVAPMIESAVSENVTKDPVLRPFADVFQGIGCLPWKYSIELNKDVRPVVHPPPHRECLFPRRKQ